MKKFLILFFIVSFCLVGCNTGNISNTESNNSYNVTKTNIKDKITSDSSEEITIANFSTTIYIKDSGRQHNIQLTSSKLNGTIVKARRNFFFL